MAYSFFFDSKHWNCIIGPQHIFADPNSSQNQYRPLSRTVKYFNISWKPLTDPNLSLVERNTFFFDSFHQKLAWFFGLTTLITLAFSIFALLLINRTGSQYSPPFIRIFSATVAFLGFCTLYHLLSLLETKKIQDSLDNPRHISHV